MKKNIGLLTLLFAVVLSLSFNSYCQTFYKTKGNGLVNETGTAIAIGNDGSIFIAGELNDSCYISRLDSTGNSVLWTKFFSLDAQSINQINQLAITSDNFLIGTVDVLCPIEKYCGSGYFKMDLNGNFIWIKEIVSSDNHFSLKKIFQLNPTTYIIVGMQYLQSGNFSDWRCFKINALTGAITLQTGAFDEDHSGLSGYLDDIFSTTELYNGYFYFTGRIYAGGSGAETMRPNVVKMDSSFNVVWSNYYFKDSNGFARIYPFDIHEYNDTIMVVYEGDKDGTGPAFSCGLLKINSNGNVIWQKDYDIPNSTRDHPASVQITTDGYLIYGSTNYISTGSHDFFFIKTDRNGNVIWTKLVGGNSSNEKISNESFGSSVLKNNYLYFTGQTYLATSQIIVGKMDLNGNINCTEVNSIVVDTATIPNYQHANTQRSETPNVVTVNSVSAVDGNLNSSCFGFSIGKDTTFCSAFSFTIQAPAISNVHYQWSNGDTTNTITVQDTGKYYVSIATECCNFSDTILVSRHAAHNKNQLIILCEGDSLKVGIHFYKNSGTYFDTLNTAYGCDSVVKTILNFYPIHYSFSKTLCKGDSIFFLGNYIKSSGIYVDTLSSFLGCDSLIALTLLFQPLPYISFTGDSAICRGESTSVTASGAQSYFWSPSLGLNSTTQNTVTASPNVSTTYTVAGFNGLCVDSSKFKIQVLANPVSQIYYNIEPCSLKVNFSTNSSSANNCKWNFGDGYLSELCSGSHTYQSQGNYTVSLHIENINTCQFDTSISVYVDELSGSGNVKIPNFFTPNGDGNNDVFYFGKTNDCYFISFEIYTALGQLLYQSSDVSKGWNGKTYNGAPCITGTYFYLLKGSSKSYSGFVELVR